METFIPWALGAIGAVVTCLAGVVAHLWRQNASFMQSQIEARDKRIEALEKKSKADEEKIDDLEKRIVQLELERARMEARFLAFQSSHDSLPLPAWFKDLSGTMLACNKAYEQVFLRARGYSLENYLGQTDFEVWPEHVAKEFERNDKEVIETGRVLDLQETVVNKAGNNVPVRIIKYPRRLIGVDEPIGVGGIAVIEDLAGIETHD